MTNLKDVRRETREIQKRLIEIMERADMDEEHRKMMKDELTKMFFVIDSINDISKKLSDLAGSFL